MFEVNSKTVGRRQYCVSDVFSVNFKHFLPLSSVAIFGFDDYLFVRLDII